jgi:uncharacterized protein YigE (DUF2233 family)
MARGRRKRGIHFSLICAWPWGFRVILDAALVLGLAHATLCLAGGPLTISESGTLKYCAIDLSRDRIRAFYTDEDGRRFGSIEGLTQWLSRSGERIVCATNGGIFGPDRKPLGWLIVDGVELQPLNVRTDQPGNFFLQPNGALSVSGAAARIDTTDALAGARPSDVTGIDIALQSGPILVLNGVINPIFDKGSVSRYTRNAVCLRDARTVLFAYSPEPLSLYAFAKALQDVGCQSALYLDGHLSQLYPDRSALAPAQREPLSVILAVTTKDPHGN